MNNLLSSIPTNLPEEFTGRSSRPTTSASSISISRATPRRPNSGTTTTRTNLCCWSRGLPSYGSRWGSSSRRFRCWGDQESDDGNSTEKKGCLSGQP